MTDGPSRRDALYAELEKLPPNVVGEIVGGELYVSPRPAIRHARASTRLGIVLGGPFDFGMGGPGGWVLLDEPELHLEEDVLVPDLAGWRRERMPELPEGVGIRLAPDWVCKVLSPSTAALDRARKMGVYAREGVRHLWLVDPSPRTLEVYRWEQGHWRVLPVHVDQARVRAEPFEAVELELGALWER
ncbi:Uma2 family endonuclease [Archangium primigenium]|uniref:Uma2 family endonuclease n=1 Tax=[Archangium] primigenium TaxID=2792470 RepID=UPI00195C1E4E|nr:Uma2 family endonuclease [Archangium primigenium]MBM7113522.1 Uma2 family endonuclease [Archangium primigenium]